VNRGAALTEALLVTLATPTTWPLALAGFLIRGGIILVALPIVVLPTPVGLGNVVAPSLTSIAFGSVSVEVLVVTTAVLVGALAWLVAGGWLAAALEAEGTRIVALDTDLTTRRAGPVTPTTGRMAARILAARLLANIPLGLVLAWGSTRLVLVAYHELTSPLDVSSPIVLRVLRGAPEVVVAIVVAWMIGQMVGALAARRIVLARAGVAGALRSALVTCLRHPLSTLADFWIPTCILVAALVPSAIATGSATGAAGAVLDEPDDPVRVLTAVLSLVLLWIVGLLLASVVCAWRAAVWTVADVARDGTFGGSADRRPGDWRSDRSSANL
jgi:hypothetical protein